MKTLFLSLLALLAPQDEKTIKDKQAEVMAFAKTAKNERDFRAVTSDLEKLALEAYEINRYELSAKLFSDAEKLARTALKDAAFGQQLQESSKRAADVGKEYTKAAKGVERILRNEGTPEDYTLSGKFLCFVKGDWELGLADLSKGKDETLKKLAEDDIAAGNQTAIGDAWFAAMKKEPGAKGRALHWYAQAWSKTTGIDREKMRQKLNLLHAPSNPGKGGPTKTLMWSGMNHQNIVAELVSTKVRSGSSALKLSIKQAGIHWPVSTPLVPVAPGKKVEITMWVLTDATNGGAFNSLLFMINGDKGAVWSSARPLVEDFPLWTKISASVVCPDGAVNTRIDITCGASVGALYIDDVSIKVDGVEMLSNGGFEGK